MNFKEYLTEVTANDHEPLGQEAKASIGQKIGGDKFKGYSNDPGLRGPSDAARWKEIRRWGGGGADERHDLDKPRTDDRWIYKFAFIPADAAKTLGTSVGRIVGYHRNGKTVRISGITPKFADVAITVFNKDLFIELASKYMEEHKSSTLQKIVNAVKESDLPSGTVSRNAPQVIVKGLPISAMEDKGLIKMAFVKLPV